MQLDKTTAIIIPDEGYTASIYKKGAELYHKFHCPIIVSGADRNPRVQNSYGLKKYLEKTITPIPIYRQIDRMIKLGVDVEAIKHESESMNTKENAINSIKILQSYFPSVDKIHLIGSLEGIVRRHLTFKKTANDLGLKINISLHPTYNLSPLYLPIYGFLLIPSEIRRIFRYKKSGDL